MLLPVVCIISLPYVNSNWSYSPETAKLGVDLCDLDLWPLTLTFCMVITSDHGNNSWKFHDDTMMGTWWKRCDRRTDRQADGRTDWTSHIAAWSQLKTHWYTNNDITSKVISSLKHANANLSENVLQEVLSTPCQISFRFFSWILTNYWLCVLFYKSVIHRPVSWFVQKHEKQQVYDGVY